MPSCKSTLSQMRLMGMAAAILLLAGCVTTEEEQKIAAAPAEPPSALDTRALALVEQALEDKRYKDAKGLVQQILLRDGKNRRAQLLWGEVLLATGSPDAGIRIFDTLTDDPALGARALQGKGLALLWTGKPEKAAPALKSAVGKDPSLWRAWNGLGFHYDSTGTWKDASNAYDKAISLNRKSALLFNNRGYSRFLQRRTEEAIRDFNAALRLDPDLKIVQVNLRLAVAWAGQYDLAALGGEKKDLSGILNNVGFVALLKGDLATAEGFLLRAIETDAAYNIRARKNLAHLQSLKKTEKNGKER